VLGACVLCGFVGYAIPQEILTAELSRLQTADGNRQGAESSYHPNHLVGLKS